MVHSFLVVSLSYSHETHAVGDYILILYAFCQESVAPC